MSRLRATAAAVIAVLGVLLLVVGLLALQADRAVVSGSAAQTVAARVLGDEAVVEAVARAGQEAITSRVEEATDSQVITVALRLLEPQLEDVIVQALTSDAVQQGLVTAVDRIEERLLVALTDPDREPAPLAVTVDAGAVVNARLDEIPVVGPFIPDVEIEPVTKELIDQATFEQVRGAYAFLHFAGAWFPWFGAAGIVAGLALARRRLRYALVVAGGLALTGLLMAFVLGQVAPSMAAGAMPGGAGGGPGVFVATFLSDTALVPFAEVMKQLCLIALIAGVALAVVLGRIGRSARSEALEQG